MQLPLTNTSPTTDILPSRKLTHAHLKLKRHFRHRPFLGLFHRPGQSYGVKEQAVRWYVIRVGHYTKAFPDKRLAEHTAEEING